MFLILDLLLNFLHPLFIFNSYILEKSLSSLRVGVDGFGLLVLYASDEQGEWFDLIVLVAVIDIGEADVVGIEFSYDGVRYPVHFLSFEGATLSLSYPSLDL